MNILKKKSNIKYWAMLIKESSMSNYETNEIIDLFNEIGYNCSELDEDLIVVNIGPILDNDKDIEDAIYELGKDIDEICNKLNSKYDLIIDDSEITYHHEYISGDEDNPRSFPGVYIKIPIEIKKL